MDEVDLTSFLVAVRAADSPASGLDTVTAFRTKPETMKVRAAAREDVVRLGRAFSATEGEQPHGYFPIVADDRTEVALKHVKLWVSEGKVLLSNELKDASYVLKVAGDLVGPGQQVELVPGAATALEFLANGESVLVFVVTSDAGGVLNYGPRALARAVVLSPGGRAADGALTHSADSLGDIYENTAYAATTYREEFQDGETTHGKCLSPPATHFCNYRLCFAHATVKAGAPLVDGVPDEAWCRRNALLKVCRSCHGKLYKKTPALPAEALANDRDPAAQYLCGNRLDSDVDHPALKRLALAQVPKRELFPELSFVEARLLSPIYLRHCTLVLRPGADEYTQYRALSGHVISYSLHQATRGALLDVDELPRQFKLIYVGKPKSLAVLRKRIRDRRARGNLPVVERDRVKAALYFFKRHDLISYIGQEDEATTEVLLAKLPECDIPDSLVQKAYAPQTARAHAEAVHAYDANGYAHTQQ